MGRGGFFDGFFPSFTVFPVFPFKILKNPS